MSELVTALREEAETMHAIHDNPALLREAADRIEALQLKLSEHEASKRAIMKLLGYPALGSWEAVYEFVKHYRPDWMKTL